MLFALALASIHLPVPSRSSLADERECTDINDCRRLFDIVWGCLATIFLCIWVSVHPNVPPPRPARPDKCAGSQSLVKWQLIDKNEPLLHRAKLMTVALVAPELIIGLATRQFVMAWSLSEGWATTLSPVLCSYSWRV
ncbi:hypothetical protein MIND_00797800 [Mycena indigotica]|uniref:Uncharacterized protein n=1 Tax=Mycena indigotica TaxID=2126181 RepID=A0A8H6SNK5_9AGAR|nr:uncharacterized protein MIND_00797800 [Mycena indigotica]KAF7302303.1 hypothetical protein MIND_00797800 [Mycena indigotica]